jgi:hypothetical protein
MSAKLFIHATSECNIYSNSVHSGDYGYNTRINSNRPKTKAFAITLNDEDRLVIYGNGTVVQASLTSQDNTAKIESPLQKICKINGYTVYSDTKELDLKFDNPKITQDVKTQLINDSKRDRFDLIGDEIEKVIPEVVMTNNQGEKMINYQGLTIVLIEAIKAQQKQIEQQEQQIEELKELMTANINVTGINTLAVSKSKLYQNNPNPFRSRTEIKYHIEESAQSASLQIYSVQGTQVKSVTIYDKGDSNIFIESSELSPGLYYYSLIVDGKEIDTKKMILTD